MKKGRVFKRFCLSAMIIILLLDFSTVVRAYWVDKIQAECKISLERDVRVTVNGVAPVEIPEEIPEPPTSAPPMGSNGLNLQQNGGFDIENIPEINPQTPDGIPNETDGTNENNTKNTNTSDSSGADEQSQ